MLDEGEMMSMLKRWGKLALIFTIILSLMPWPYGLAAEAESKYFSFPQNLDLEKSTPDKPFIYEHSEIDLQGIFDEVQSNSLTITVEQIYRKQNGEYAPVENSYYTREITTVQGNTFEAKAVTLFAGLNRLTLSGVKAGVTLKDEFYIYYDSSPYILDLSIFTNTDEATPLNAGAGTVVTSSDAFIEGRAPNAVSIVINESFTVQPLYDGTFFSPVLELNPGKNVITIEVFGSSDYFKVERTVYYFDGQQFIFEGQMYFDYNGDGAISDAEKNNQKPVIGTTSTFAVPFNTPGFVIEGGFVGKMMVRNISSVDLDPTAHISAMLDGDAHRVRDIQVNNKTPIRSGNDHRIEYYVYDLSFKVDVDTSDSQSLTHLIEIQTDYEGLLGTDIILFNFADSNHKIVEDVQWLYDYENNPTAKKPLQGAEIHAPNIYIEVTKNSAFTAADVLEVYLTPYDPNNSITVTQISTDGQKGIYKIENIPPGSHTMVINFEDTPNVYDYLARVDYVSGAKAVFMNLIDGMNIKIEDAPKFVEMMIRNVGSEFDPKTAARFSINGTVISSAFDDYDGPDKPFRIDISSHPLQVGENRLEVQLTYDGFVTTKEIFVYVSDDNLPMIEILKPVIGKNPRPRLNNEQERRQLYADMNGLVYENDVYYTTAYEYDLVMEVRNFNKFQLQYDGEFIIDYTKSSSSLDNFPGYTVSSHKWADGKKIDHYYDPARDRLVVRVEALEFPAPGSQVFNLRVTSATSSQASQRIEIVREEVPYEVVSPVATTDNKIIVNKNFVHVIIRAENANGVIIDKKQAVKMDDPQCGDCFELEYIGLKENRWNDIKFTVIRGEQQTDGVIEVYYAKSLSPGAQYKQPLDRRMRVFDRALQLEFEKGTLLQTKISDKMTPSLYENQQILFGIADPETGMVEDRTDKGEIKSVNRALESTFSQFPQNFTFISPVYWISGGLAEKGTPGTSGYRPRMDGITPHNRDTSLTYTFTDPARHLVPNKRGELTLKYNEIVREAAGIEVSVFHFNSEGKWVNLGGVINTKSHEITVPFDEFGYYVVGILRHSFPDIQGHKWAADVLKAMYSKGFMNAARYMEFGADDYITRGEYAQLMVKALQLPLNYDNRNTFVDVQPRSAYGNFWEYKYVETAARAGIVQGVQDRIFAPNQPLTRDQAAVMIARALELKLPANDERLDARLRKEFTDVDSISYYARPSVMAVYNKKIMLGEPTVTSGGDESYRFNPKALLTRAEAAAIAVRVMQSELNYFPKNLN